MSSSSEDDLPPERQRASRAARRAPSPFYVPLPVTFYILLISNGLAAAYAPIQDCDETFNYWEPTHYLQHGHGRQTWEYSPEYGIRSWLYILLHAAVGKVSSVWASRKTTQFYVIRSVLAFVCAACETRLYSAISRSLNPRIGVLFLLIVTFSPGFFHASAAYLPSSFAMYTSMLGLAALLNRRGNRRFAEGIVWFGVGAIVGWPFSGALLLPLLLEEMVTAGLSGRFYSTLWDVGRGAYDCMLILGLEVLVDSVFFGKTVVVPWNVVAYNVFGGQGRGPSVFGTEPWTFYARNLLLNFNVWFILAMLTAPLVILQALFRNQTAQGQSFIRSITFIFPLYMWLAIFTLQPHKEERFMYPVYPFLALNAALSLHWILSYIGTSRPGTLMGLIPAKLKLAAVVAFLSLSVVAGLLRSLGVVTAYRAPMEIYNALEEVRATNTNHTVCLGKEWYRFPSSFFLPGSMRVQFVRSEFRGLLPGEFPDSESVGAILAGTSSIPTGMNDRNEEDPGKYVNPTECTFLVDSSFPSRPSPPELEPDYIQDVESWEKVSCAKFLDAGLTPTVGRLVWIPDVSFLPDRYRRRWGEYCLLRRRSFNSLYTT